MKRLMKTSLYTLGAAALLLTLLFSSCSEVQDLESPSLTLTISAGLEPGSITKATAIHGELFAGVFKEDGTLVGSEHTSGTFPVSLPLKLVKGVSYKIVLWAQEGSDGILTYDTTWSGESLRSIDVTSCKDAFTGVVQYTAPTASAPAEGIEVTLTRPFGRVALLASPGALSGLSLTSATFKVEQMPGLYDALSGEFSSGGEVTAFSAAPTSEPKTIDGTAYTELLHFFVPAGEEQGSISGSFTLSGEGDFSLSKQFSGLSIKRNFRTNIILSSLQ